MQLAVLGATGRTGVPLVEGSLARGHRVTCLVRDDAKARSLLPVDDPGLRLQVGDATDATAIDRVVAGAEAVVDVTGPVRGGPRQLRSEVVAHLLAAMERHETDRLVFVTGAGVRIEGDTPGVVDRAIRGLLALVQPEILDDGQAAVAAIMASELDWTVVRVPRLTSAEPVGTIRAAPHVAGGFGSMLGRGDLAEFLLDELERPAWMRQAPVVSR